MVPTTTENDNGNTQHKSRFVEIPDWAAFREAWEKNRFQEAAIGMLYAVPDLLWLTSGQRCAGIDFLVEVGDGENEEVAKRAQQILVSRFTRMVRDDDVPALRALVKYLGKVRKGTWGDPYPDMIRRFLTSCHRRFVRRLADEPDIAQQAWYCDLDEVFTPALLVWGSALVLPGTVKAWPHHYERCIVLEKRIENFLRERSFGEDLYAEAMTWRDDPMKDMSSQSAEDIVNGIAVRALFSLREQRKHLTLPCATPA